jgi:hypothetical protein
LLANQTDMLRASLLSAANTGIFPFRDESAAGTISFCSFQSTLRHSDCALAVFISTKGCARLSNPRHEEQSWRHLA